MEFLDRAARAASWPFFNFVERRVRAFWRLLIQFVSMGVILTVTLVAIAVSQPSLESMIPMASAQGSVILLTVWCACLVLDRRRIRQLGFAVDRNWWINLGVGLALGALLIGVIFLLHVWMGWIEFSIANASLPKQIGNQATWIFAMTMVGLGEETLSRGYMMKNIAEGLRPLGLAASNALAVLLSGSVFALLHAGNDSVSFIALASVFGAGIMLGIARLTTGSLAAPIGMHIAWNYAQGGLFGFPVSGNKIGGSIVEIQSTVDNAWTGGAFGPEAGYTGIIAVGVATFIFIVWPNGRAHVKEESVAMVRYKRMAGRWLA